MRSQTIFLWFSLLASPLAAQNGSVRGVVTDQSGAFVDAVPVIVTNTATGVGQTVQTG